MKKWFLHMHFRRASRTILLLFTLSIFGGVVEFLLFPERFPQYTIWWVLCCLFPALLVLLAAVFHQFQEIHRELRQSYHNTEIRMGLERQVQPRAPMPPTRHWAASPDFLQLIVEILQEHKPQVVVELGSGVSTLYTAYLLEQNGQGKLYSIEHLADFATETRQRLHRHQLSQWVEVIHAPLVVQSIGTEQKQWYQPDFIAELPLIDLLVVDGPPWKLQRESRYPALPLLYERLAPQARILVDDYLRADEKRMVRRWLEAYPAFKLKEYPYLEKQAALLWR